MGWKWGPLTAFGIIATPLTILVILVYILVCLATIVYYRTKARDRVQPAAPR